MSVAVAINHRSDKDGNVEPIDEKEIEQIRNLVIQASGYTEARGDTISVANTRFNNGDPVLPIWKDPFYLSIGSDALKYLAVLCFLAFIWFKIGKPVIRSITYIPEEAPSPEDVAAAAILAGGADLSLPSFVQDDGTSPREADGYEENIRAVREIAKEDPRAVSMVMRGWKAIDGDEIEKCAILMMSLGEEAAAGVIKNMNQIEIQDLGAAMATMKPLTRSIVNGVLKEFRQGSEQYRSVTFGSPEYIRQMLVTALGEDRASDILEDIMDASNVENGIEELNSLEPISIAELIADEHPQVIATMLVHLDRDRAAGVLNLLPERLRVDVVVRIATFGGVQPVALHELTDVLNGVLSGQSARRSKLGGARTAAEILNAMNSSDEESIVKSLRQQDPDLSSRIEDEMFVFENIADLDDAGIQLVLQNAGNEVWAVALKGAKPAMVQRILGNMSMRAAELIREDMEVQGPLRVSVVEAEQRKVLGVVRSLADSGQISLKSNAEDEYV